jgi:hypothetical protein
MEKLRMMEKAAKAAGTLVSRRFSDTGFILARITAENGIVDGPAGIVDGSLMDGKRPGRRMGA